VGTKVNYSRYVPATKEYSFSLRNTARDALLAAAEDTLWVDVVPGRASSGEVGLLDAAGG
jgi:hypothetical protein